MTTLMERKVEGAQHVVALKLLSGERLLVHLVHGENTAVVYEGESGREALDAFNHPFARPDVPDIFSRSTASEELP